MKDSRIFGWTFFLILMAVGLLNIALIHHVPGIAYMLISLIYLPQANMLLKRKLDLSIHPAIKIILAIIIIFFTLGVSDLGERID